MPFDCLVWRAAEGGWKGLLNSQCCEGETFYSINRENVPGVGERCVCHLLVDNIYAIRISRSTDPLRKPLYVDQDS